MQICKHWSRSAAVEGLSAWQLAWLVIAPLEHSPAAFHIVEAREKHKGIERNALWLSQTVLEEKWNQAIERCLFLDR